MNINYFKFGKYVFINYKYIPNDIHVKIHETRNLDSIRGVMANKNIFSLKEHYDFVNVLKKRDDLLYIAVLRNKEFVASISLHPINETDRIAEWGIYIVPGSMEKGETALISDIFFKHIAANSVISTIKASIIHKNNRSIAFHKKLGFTEKAQDNEYVYMEKTIKTNNRVFIIAEMSANHNGSLKTAIDTVYAAKDAGADAIKIQTYTADTITLDCRKNDFKIGGTIWDGKYLYDLYKEAYTPWEWHKEIFDAAKDAGITCLSSPFDKTAVDFLEKLGCPLYKIASFEITDIPLIEHTAKKMKPMIISTGIATEEDIELAVKTCCKVGNNDITLLKCTSSYPAKIEDANLATIPDMAKRFGVKVGLSDHTMGFISPIVAISLGAILIEKHFIIDRSIGGPDSSFSMDKNEFAEMVKAVRTAEASIGKVSYPKDISTIKGRQFCRSLYVAEDVKQGDTITEKNVRSVRPGYGLEPKYLPNILGKVFNCDLTIGTPMSLDYIS